MKTNIWTFAIALMCLRTLTACNEKKTETTEVSEVNDTTLETKKMSEEDHPKTEILDEEEAIAEIDDDGDDWENEVWTALGGTYCFFGDGEQYAVDFPVGEDRSCVTLYIRGEEYQAEVNRDNGLITAYDDNRKEVFRGAIYAGGNLLKGTYRGEQIKVWGSGD